MKKIFTLCLVLASLVSFSQSTTLVISQVYGAGGNSGALYNADYVELHNVSGVSQSLTGLSIQYGSSAVTGAWSGVYALPSVSVPAGGYYLIQMSAAGATGASLPTPDAIANPPIAMAAANGRVALVNGTTALNACPAVTEYIDFVGYGTSTCFEGTGPTAVISATLAAFRNNNGCTDTNNNANDFSVAAPAPRNSASAAVNCVAIPPSLTVTGTLTNFGSVFIGSSSASQSYTISGANLTGAPGVITVTAPSSDFQVSLNNTTFTSSVAIPYTSATLAATTVYVRFTPQTAGPKSGNVTNSGGGVSTAVTVAVAGTGTVPPTPTLSAGSLTAFGNVCINTTAGPNSFTINGTNLTTADITVGALAGYTYATTSTGTYTNTLTLTQPGGTYAQTIYVKFSPTANQAYNGNIVVSGGGASSLNIAASGTGNNNAPAVTTNAASAITTAGATLSGSITSTGCTAVTAYGFEYSLTSGFATGTVVASSNLSGGIFTAPVTGLSPATTYYFKAFATNGGGRTYGAERSFTTATPTFVTTTLTAFGASCVGTSSAVQNFTLTSTNLGTAPVVVGPLAGYSFSTSATGTFTQTLNINQPGGPFSQVVYVKLTPTALQSYNGSIPVSGGNATNAFVSVSGSGVNTPATVTTNDATSITPNNATLSGSISNTGCSAVSEQGFEYSGIPGLANGLGTRVIAPSGSADFTVTLNNLVANSTYYFRAYSRNAGGLSYGAEKSFKTTNIPAGFIIYGSPVKRGSTLHFSVTGIAPGHYTARFYNSLGAQAFQKDFILQGNYLDERFVLPGFITPGVYTMRIVDQTNFSIQKTFMIL